MDSVGSLLAASALPRQEAQSLLELAAGLDRVAQVAHPERVLMAQQVALVQALFARRRTGEPLAYMLGEREFWGLAFKVNPAVLIPRPETELLVELALERLPPHAAARVLDLGTGSGAVAIALAHERPGIELTAVDVSADALAVARANASRHGVHVEFALGDWFAALAGRTGIRFDLILGNPPYIAAADPHLARGDLPHEPAQALVAGPEGLDALRNIVSQAGAHLAPGGWLLLEHGFDQESACQALFERAAFAQIRTWRDLAGLPRVTGGRLDPQIDSAQLER
jgi:release factor glutamine methyltransferase